jgi:ParB family transcriptional regulator, chromosome partitioning protein
MSKIDPNKNRPRLGRGLSSLISLTDTESQESVPTSIDEVPVPLTRSDAPAEPVMKSIPAAVEVSSSEIPGGAEIPAGVPKWIPLESIVPNPSQPRRQFDELALKELADSIKTNGVIQPIVVKQIAEGRYELIAGERRWRASAIAGKTDIPAVLRQADAHEQAQLALVENIQRQDLNPIERALAYRSLIADLGLTQVELAHRLGQDKATMSHYLRLLELPAGAQALVAQGLLSMSHAKLILGVADAAQQDRLAKLSVSQQLSLKNLERVIAQLNEEQGDSTGKPTGKVRSAHYAELEQQLTRSLGSKVLIQPGSKQGTGKLVLSYTNLDEFDKIMEKLGVALET